MREEGKREGEKAGGEREAGKERDRGEGWKHLESSTRKGRN